MDLLRAEAEKRLSRPHGQPGKPRLDPPSEQLLHELQVRQVELEVQNEELQRANLQLAEAKSSVQEGLDRYTELYDLAPLAYFTLSPAGTIERSNALGSQLLWQRSPQGSIKRFAALLADESLGVFDTFLRALFACSGKQTCEVQMREPCEPRCLVVELTGQVELDGRSCNIALVDITERTLARREIERLNQALQERVLELGQSNRELEAFSFSVAHDLQAPLLAIDGFRSVLDQSLQEQDWDGARHCAERIDAAVAHMSHLTTALLELAQITRTGLHIQRVDLSEMAEEVLRGFREREPGRHVTIEVQPKVIVKGDPVLLRQVLENLLGNAWKFTSRRSEALVSFSAEWPDAQTVLIHVRDNGAGFDMAFSERLFGTFERLHTQSEFPGTGIGLATVKRIIGRHGGRIEAHSEPERGATFSFSLPAVLAR